MLTHNLAAVPVAASFAALSGILLSKIIKGGMGETRFNDGCVKGSVYIKKQKAQIILPSLSENSPEIQTMERRLIYYSLSPVPIPKHPIPHHLQILRGVPKNNESPSSISGSNGFPRARA